jgi:hypothetical protein
VPPAGLRIQHIIEDESANIGAPPLFPSFAAGDQRFHERRCSTSAARLSSMIVPCGNASLRTARQTVT